MLRRSFLSRAMALSATVPIIGGKPARSHDHTPARSLPPIGTFVERTDGHPFIVAGPDTIHHWYHAAVVSVIHNPSLVAEWIFSCIEEYGSIDFCWPDDESVGGGAPDVWAFLSERTTPLLLVCPDRPDDSPSCRLQLLVPEDTIPSRVSAREAVAGRPHPGGC